MTSLEDPGSLTICIPAFNEEAVLTSTVQDVYSAACSCGIEFQIIIVNDGSTDNTGLIADGLARDDRVSALHFPFNRGVGAAFKAALALAAFQHITLIPGDHAYERQGLETLFRNVGKADMAITYRGNKATRPPLRRFLSMIFSMWARMMTRCPIRDGHSLYIFPVPLTRNLISKMPDDHRYHVVTLVHLLRSVTTYSEFPVDLRPRADASSSVLTLPFISKITYTMAKLSFESFSEDTSATKPRIIEVSV